MVLPVSSLDDLVRRITAVEADILNLGVRRLAALSPHLGPRILAETRDVLHPA